MNRRFKDKYSLKIKIGRTGEPFQQAKKKHMCYNFRWNRFKVFKMTEISAHVQEYMVEKQRSGQINHPHSPQVISKHLGVK